MLLAVVIQGSLSGATLTLPFAVLPLVQDAAPLLPAASGCLVGAVLVRRMPELEVRGPVLIRYRAELAVSILLAVAAIGAVGLVAAPTRYDAVILRNACAFGGLALAGATLLGARMAWLPVMLVALVTFLDGKNRYDGSARAWAFLLQPASEAWSLCATVTLVVFGVLAYACVDSRAQRGLREA